MERKLEEVEQRPLNLQQITQDIEVSDSLPINDAS
jgi:hypothetical protein